MKLNKAREKLVQLYLDSLKEDKIPWSQGWDNDYSLDPHNPVTKIKYHGVNNALLNIVSIIHGYDDQRWMTFNQIVKQGWSLHDAKDKGVPVEYWSVYDKVNKKNISFTDYNKIMSAHIRDKSDFSLISKTYFVFNAKFIKGIPELNREEFPRKMTNYSPFIKELIENMNVSYIETGNQPCYSPSNDTVYIPKRSQFRNEYEFETTLLHELSHATGHPTRLNRPFVYSMKDKEYAKEELRAEISASFLAQDLKLVYSTEQINNHTAYIQNWIDLLENNPEELFKAIKAAEEISDYLLKTGDIEKHRELQQDDDLLDQEEVDIDTYQMTIKI